MELIIEVKHDAINLNEFKESFWFYSFLLLRLSKVCLLVESIVKAKASSKIILSYISGIGT